MTGSANLQSSNGGNGGTGGGEEQGGADSKNNSPPSSNGGSRRSSLADLPKAILSSFRRSSIVGPADTGSILAAASCASMAVLGAGSTGGGGSTIAEEGENQDEDNPHFSRPPPKSILKKRPTEADLATPAVTGGTAASSEFASESVSTTAAAAGAAAAANANSGQHAGSIDQTLISETVHPMATADMDVADINLLTPTDHRARLLTHSPTPTHPQQHLVNIGKNPMLVGGAGSPIPSNNSDSVSSNNKVEQQSSSTPSSQPQLSQGAALPPDFTPGVQSNSSKDRGGERGQGSVGDYMSQDELLTQQMIGISSRAQDLANQYYGSNSTNNQTSTNSNLAPIASTAAACAGGKRRSINFRETIEIIPAYRKSDYNRASDKHATFKILTPDMKSEIRDELNTYKMREMAVHVDSMANTAFH
ncbi:hypothetical protein BGZ97_012265 [Linnemannia gamsii]|uniref:Uncharacterized protein n=1 Tax=Linnemannia gamsii TaxID=64522 RepID=A0A9P6R1M5_9FUNG|nr:hypothetical protein BGZ97_012265 [Linnemannia gamsii]